MILRYIDDRLRSRAAVAANTASWPLDAIPKRLVAALRAAPDATLAVATRDLKFKDLRHTAVLRLREAGCSIDDIRAITGHANPATVLDHYLAASAAVTRAVLEKRLRLEAGE